MIKLKTAEQIKIMDEANRIVHKVLDEIEAHISPGVTTKELDSLAEDTLIASAAKPAFKGYMGYPASACISINEEVVHGIPGDRVIQDGDIVSVDVGSVYEGFVGDAARTFMIGDVSEEAKALVNNTREALIKSMEILRIGKSLYDFGSFMSDFAKKNGYGNVKKFCGHGIGEKMHEPPRVLNYVDPSEPNIHFQEGLVLALEPMFTLGKSDVKVLDDKWTVITVDKSVAAHWEVSVAITKDGPKILGGKL